MYFTLFQVISEYCRCFHQVKPFSHIVMDLFKETIDCQTIDNQFQSQIDTRPIAKSKTLDEQK